MRVPKYRLHKGSGQALVQYRGQRIYLGVHGSPESRRKYREFVAKLLADPACRVWSCERTGVTREIDVLEWARENEEERIVRILEARKP